MTLCTWYRQATEGVNYYRAEMPAKHLPGKVVSLNMVTMPAYGPDGEPEFGGQEGAAVWMFPGNLTRWLLMSHQRDLGYPVFVEVDDNYTQHPPTMGTVSSTWEIKFNRDDPDKHSYQMHMMITKRLAQGVICSTPYLAGIYSRFHRNVHVCRNAVDLDDWEPDPPHQSDGILRVGFAGSASHIHDIRDLHRAFDWASRQKDVEVWMFGENPRWKFPYRQVQWTTSLDAYRKAVRILDVMVCPIRPSVWANCKSDIKAMEGAMAGAVPVVSRTEPFRPWWDEGRPCYSYETEKDLLRVVKHLVANREEAASTWKEAYGYVTAERNIRDTVTEWRDALSSVTGGAIRGALRTTPLSSLQTALNA